MFYAKILTWNFEKISSKVNKKSKIWSFISGNILMGPVEMIKQNLGSFLRYFFYFYIKGCQTVSSYLAISFMLHKCFTFRWEKADNCSMIRGTLFCVILQGIIDLVRSQNIWKTSILTLWYEHVHVRNRGYGMFCELTTWMTTKE